MPTREYPIYLGGSQRAYDLHCKKIDIFNLQRQLDTLRNKTGMCDKYTTLSSDSKEK